MMARHRRGPNNDTEGGIVPGTVGKPKDKRKRHSSHWIFKSKTTLYACVFAVTSVIVVLLYSQYARKVRIITPLPEPLAVMQSGLDVPDRFWGTYRPGCYFGIKARMPQSPLFGLVWFPQTIVDNQLPVRHWCEQSDRLLGYGWLQHDGVNFGVQEIEESFFKLNTTFVKRPGGQHGGDWTARISALPKKTNEDMMVSILFYVALEGMGRLQPVLHGSYLAAIQGDTEELGPFRVSFESSSQNIRMAHHLITVCPGLHVIKETIMRGLAVFPYNKNNVVKLIGLVGNQMKGDYEGWQPNLLVYQVTVNLPFEMEVVFESGSFPDRPNRLIGDSYSSELAAHGVHFRNKFEQTFRLVEKGFGEDHVKFAQAALSNMLGGIGYFYGTSRVQSQFNPEPMNYWQAPLYTAVPSRSFFPRGFLWDEGFHNLLICQWDSTICMDIISHWLDLMNVEGWIPREQILGQEAQSKVPEEFVVQRNTNANPPTLFLPLQYLIREAQKSKSMVDENFKKFLTHIFPRLKIWFNWFNTTQAGEIQGSYRWRGREKSSARELNPKTLSSGLDDYPRASNPTSAERHLDLRCWLSLAASVMAEIGSVIGEPMQEFLETHNYLADNKVLDQFHWSSELETYADFGFHSNKVRLERPKPKNVQPGKPIPKMEKVRVALEEPTLQFVDSFGYISLFPFLTQIIDPNSAKLGKILLDIRNPDLLWTKYGLRSLAKSAPLYMKYNTEHDPPYWRGPIWINMNFLALRALHNYGNIEGPHTNAARSLYRELKQNIVQNMYKDYLRTGYIWEQYNDVTGQGQGSHPFTGWSALIVLIMSDSY